MPTITGNRPIFRIRYKDAEIREVRKGNDLQGGLYYITYINKGPKDIVVGREEGQNIPDYVGGYPNLSTEDFYLYIPDNASAIESGEALGESYAYRSHSSGGYDNAGCLIDDGGIFNYIPAITRDFHRDLTLFCKGTQRRYLYSGIYKWEKEGETSEGDDSDEPDPEDPDGHPSHNGSPQQPHTQMGQNWGMVLYNAAQDGSKKYAVRGAAEAGDAPAFVSSTRSNASPRYGAVDLYGFEGNTRQSARAVDVFNTAVEDVESSGSHEGRNGCTWGCKYRSLQCGGRDFSGGHAGQWYGSDKNAKYRRDKTALKAGNVICFKGGGFGHVAYIEKVGNTYFGTSEGADAGGPGGGTKHGSGLCFSCHVKEDFLKANTHGFWGEDVIQGILENSRGPGGTSPGPTPQPY